jgi:hypothetical protein
MKIAVDFLRIVAASLAATLFIVFMLCATTIVPRAQEVLVKFEVTCVDVRCGLFNKPFEVERYGWHETRDGDDPKECKECGSYLYILKEVKS